MGLGFILLMNMDCSQRVKVQIPLAVSAASLKIFLCVQRDLLKITMLDN